MCAPALPLIAAGLTAASSLAGGIGAMQQANYKAKVAERNAAMEREAGQQEIENTRTEALNHYRKIAQMKGAQIARAAANGVSVDYGTAADVVADTEMLGREDVGRIYQQGYQNLRGRDIGASNYEAEANASRASGKMAMIGGVLDAGSSILTGAQQYSKMKAK